MSLSQTALFAPFMRIEGLRKSNWPNESRDVELKIPRDRLETYTAQGEKIFEGGVYYFLSGPNARDLPLIASAELRHRSAGGRVIDVPDGLTVDDLRARHLAFSGLDESANIPDIYKTMDRPVSQQEFEQLLGRKVPEQVALRGVHAPLSALRGPCRSLFLKIALKKADTMPGDREMNRQAILSMPLRALARLSDGILSPRLLKLIVFLSLRGPYRAKRKSEARQRV